MHRTGATIKINSTMVKNIFTEGIKKLFPVRDENGDLSWREIAETVVQWSLILGVVWALSYLEII